MKRLATLLFLILCSVGAMAQNRAKVFFYIFDEQTKQPLQGAVVEVASAKDGSDKSYYTSGRGGYMEFSVPMGEYTITTSFIGYADRKFGCNANTKILDLGKIYMRESVTKIDAVIRAIGTPWKAFGASSNSMRSRKPAKITNAKAKPNAIETL